jgi:MATE family multidrug resistance protein
MSIFSGIYRPLLALALPLILIQVCQASLGLIDTMVAGQYNYKDLAGVGLGSAMWSPVFILMTGIMYVLVPKMSDFAASGRQDEMYRLFLKGKKIAFWLAVAGFVIVQLLAISTFWFIDDPAVAGITRHYLHFVAFALPGLTYILLFRFVSEGNSQLRPMIKVAFILLVCNTLLNLIFVFGIHGFQVSFQGLGGAGCGLATAISAYIALFVLQRLVKAAVPEIRRMAVEPIVAKQAKQLFAEGLPIGVAFVVEALALTILAFFAASLGAKEVAAHQIAINIAMVIFMIPLALSSATTIRIAHCSNATDSSSGNQTAKAAILMAIAYGLGMSACIMTLGQPILHAFSHDERVLQLTAGLLIYVAAFQLFDAIQIVAAGILRGLQVFVSPMLVILATYWVLVIPMCYFITGHGWWIFSGEIDSIWLLLSGGIALAAFVLGIRSFTQLHKMTARRLEHR